eukprot:6477875-Amphidinium_carterae.1
MSARGMMLDKSRLGSAGNSFLGRAVVLSIPRYTLQVCEPNNELASKWDQCVVTMLPRHKSFLKGALPRLKELFGFPTNLPLLQQVALEAQLGQICKLSHDPRELIKEVQEAVGAGPLLDPIRGWR